MSPWLHRRRTWNNGGWHRYDSVREAKVYEAGKIFLLPALTGACAAIIGLDGSAGRKLQYDVSDLNGVWRITLVARSAPDACVVPSTRKTSP